MTTAAIDLGTNSARLLIGDISNGAIERHQVVRRITRLGGGFNKATGISDEAADRTLVAMNEFAAIMADAGVSQVRAVATSAVRDAANRDSFCSRVLEESGIALDIISGDEEGRLTLLGVLSGLDRPPEAMLLFDIGGGSTEYTLAGNGVVEYTRSYPLGVVRLTEGKGGPAAMADKIHRELAVLEQELRESGLLDDLSGRTLLGTAGTATTLAAISMGLTDYDYRKVNNYTLTYEEVAAIYGRLLPLTPAERLATVAGLEKGREDLIIAGTLLTLSTMERFGFSQMKVSDFGLLEGILISMNHRESC